MADTTLYKKYGHNKTVKKLEKQELMLIDPMAYKQRCELELGSWRNIKTFTDCVSLGEAAINGLLSGARDIKQSTAIGYLLAVQLQAIKCQKSEQNNSELLSERVKLADTTINMTPEEMKSLVYATHANFQINIINKSADRPDMSKAVGMQVDIDGSVDCPDIIRNVILDAKAELKEENQEMMDIEISPTPKDIE